MKNLKLFFGIMVLSFVSTNVTYAIDKNEVEKLVYKAQSCYRSLPSYAQESVIDTWLDTITYWNDAVKMEKMGNNLAGAYFRNAEAYAGVVLQVGAAYGSQACSYH